MLAMRPAAAYRLPLKFFILFNGLCTQYSHLPNHFGFQGICGVCPIRFVRSQRRWEQLQGRVDTFMESNITTTRTIVASLPPGAILVCVSCDIVYDFIA